MKENCTSSKEMMAQWLLGEQIKVKKDANKVKVRYCWEKRSWTNNRIGTDCLFNIKKV